MNGLTVSSSVCWYDMRVAAIWHLNAPQGSITWFTSIHLPDEPARVGNTHDDLDQHEISKSKKKKIK